MTRLTYTSGSIDADTSATFEAELKRVRKQTPEPFGHTIAGSGVQQGELFERRNPAFLEEVASRAHAGGSPLVAQAVQAAREASKGWRYLGYPERCRLLRSAAAAIAERKPEMAAIISLETGKNRVEALGEVQEAVDLIETYCREMEVHEGFRQRLANFAENERNEDVLRPYGVFAVIGPFNFPLALCVGMASAALVAGNTVVLKPSEEAPWSAQLIADVLAEAGLPAGVFNLVHGPPTTGAALVGAEIDGVAFTGSAEVGRKIAKRMQEGPFARPALTEMGGKNPAIVTAAADLDKAAEGVTKAAYGLSGQKCSSCSRAIVLDAVADDFLERLGTLAEALKIGNPEDEDSFLGPVINEKSVWRFEVAAAEAKSDGRLVAGGARPSLPGYYVEPTVVADLPLGHRLTRDELFLPFVSVTRVADLDEALEEANAVVYGLTAGIFSEDPDEVERFFDCIEAGVTYVNRGAGATTGAWPGTQSFCGWKSSGSTGKGGLGPHYVPQFMREQSRTIVS
jgi:1-pyrroline-5-carboxylate dehydrogenase